MLEGYVDIYLPDFKYMDAGLAGKYSNARGLSGNGKGRPGGDGQTDGSPVFSEDGMMKKGVIVRHIDC